MSSENPPPPKKEDVVFVHSVSEGGDAVRVIRKREETLELGELRAVEEGRPLSGDLVRLSPRAEHDRLFDVEVLVSREETSSLAARSGPPQIATETYRKNWEAIFGQEQDKQDKPKLLN